MKPKAWLIAVGLILPFASDAARDQPYPVRPIRLVVPSPGGGGMDTLARTIGQHLTEEWRQQVVVDARPGATGIIGTDIVAKSTPDGYTLLLAWIAPLAINPALYKKLPYDVSKDLAPVMLVATTPHVLVVAPSLGVTSVKDFTALAKAKPGQLSYASSGIAETVSGFDAETWYGLLAPAGAPKTIVSALNAEIARFLKQREVAQKLAVQGFDVVASSPLEFAAYLQSELEKWRKVIQAARIRAE